MKIKTFISLITLFLLFACGSETKQETTDTSESKSEEKENPEPRASVVQEEEKFTVIKGETKELLDSYYQLPHIAEWYKEELNSEEEPTNMVVPADLSKLSYEKLRLLRNEVFARNGYLFNDGYLRGHFNRYLWYRPIFEVDTFRIVLTSQEQQLVNDLRAEEKRRKEQAFVSQGSLNLFNADLVANTQQFLEVNEKIQQDLKKNNFSIVEANRAMPFYIYDQNAYNYVPHYITTDVYLFILHKFFGKYLERLDQNYLSKQLTSVITNLAKEAAEVEYGDVKAAEAIAWAQAYSSVARYALTSETVQVNTAFQDRVDSELLAIRGFSGGPALVPNRYVSYTELEPRGHYTKTEPLKKYFKAFKWLSLNGVNLEDDTGLSGMVALAYLLKSNEATLSNYQAFTKVMTKLAGEEDNLSMKDLLPLIDAKAALPELLTDATLNRIKTALLGLKEERIKPVTPGAKHIDRLYFFSSTYSISAEIFSKLVQVDGNNSKRSFPRALDVPAVFDNPTAQQILMEEYDDDNEWSEFIPRVEALKKTFKDFNQWEVNYANKGLQTALAATAESDSYPDFLKTDAYNRKELSTMLSSWTHIKHDLVLYQEKPWAAESGQGGGPPAPNHYSYVEPNIAFWEEALTLVDWLMELDRYDNSLKSALLSIKRMGEDILVVARKQQSGEEITAEEFDKLHRIGGRIEYTLLDILDTDHLPEREKSMALITDIFTSNGTQLNVGVGHADDMYVVVPIKGEYYLARGATFSFYEFQSAKLFTDEEWRDRAKKRDLPSRPRWIAPLIHDDIAPLKANVQYRYPGWSMLRY